MPDPGQLALCEKLGFEPGAKVVVAHQDDVGMCHGANVAFADLAGRGFITSGSVMVPCPWFSEIADLAGDHDDWCLGVHLTLTSEWRHYRWRPLTGVSKRSGLTDADGFMWRTAQDVRAHADPTAVETELRAQMDTALAAGIDITHLDCHMGTALAPEFADIYLRLGADYDVPVLFPNDWDDYGGMLRLGEGDPSGHERRLAELAHRLNPLFDAVVESPWGPPAESDAAYSRMLADLRRGL